MASTSSKIPRILAVVGVVIGFVLMAVWWYVYKYDPFHLPTTGSFSEPMPLKVLEYLTSILCPGSLLQILTMDTGVAMACLMWIIAALINGPLYYAIGLIIAALMKRGRAGGPV